MNSFLRTIELIAEDCQITRQENGAILKNVDNDKIELMLELFTHFCKRNFTQDLKFTIASIRPQVGGIEETNWRLYFVA